MQEKRSIRASGESKPSGAPKKYSRQNRFVYESGPFCDYFRALPFKGLKGMLRAQGISLDKKTVLIASCGCGIDAHYLKKFYSPERFCFTDIRMAAIEKTQSNFYEHFFAITDTQQMSFCDNSFDYVFTAASLHHLKEPVSGLYELLRVSREGVIVIEPNDSWLTRIFIKLGLAHEYEKEHGNYVYRFNRDDVAKISKAMFKKYALRRIFAFHWSSGRRFKFLFMKSLNALANALLPSQGNYIIFVIRKNAPDEAGIS